MTATWPVRKHPAASFVNKSFIHPVLCHPFRSLLVVLGIILLTASMQAHAYTPIAASLSPSEVFLQPGTQVSGVVFVQLPYSWESGSVAHVSFDIQSPPGIVIDGSLNSFDTPISVQRNFFIRAENSVPEGTYFATIWVGTILDGFSQSIPLPITIHIGPSSHFIYQTTGYSTLAPFIEGVSLSPSHLSLSRVDSGSSTISFTHRGSTTDYLIRLAEPMLGITVSFSDDTHRLVEDGEVVSSPLTIKTTPFTPHGTFPLRIEAYDLATGQSTFLRTLLVEVKESVHVLSSLPHRSFTIPAGGSTSSLLTLQNTEYDDVSLILESSSSSVVFDSRLVDVPARSSVDVNITLFSADDPSVSNETIYVIHPSFTDEIHFSVVTSQSPSEDEMSDSPEGIDPSLGLLSGVSSSIWGLLAVILSILLLFSSRFRNRVIGFLPKTKVPEKKA